MHYKTLHTLHSSQNLDSRLLLLAELAQGQRVVAGAHLVALVLTNEKRELLRALTNEGRVLPAPSASGSQRSPHQELSSDPPQSASHQQQSP